MSSGAPAKAKRGTKILCTLGPSSLNRDVIQRLDVREVDYFRINLSHTPIERLEPCIALIRSCSQTPICIDSEGAQVRTGTVREGLQLADRERVVLRAEPDDSDRHAIVLTPRSVFDTLRPGHLITLDSDSALVLVEKIESVGRARAVVLNGGRVGSNKAVSVFPPPDLPALSPKDRAAVEIARRHGITDFALSFANRAADVAELRALAGRDATIIAKIESKNGVRNLDAILDEADAILIDRGDLSRDVPLESLPLLQKAIIRKAGAKGRPVYVATNLLESMLKNRTPTRAEVNDVMNTLIDGAGGLVLAAETAIGQQPVLAVDILCSLIGHYSRAVDGCRIEDLLEFDTGLLPCFHGSTRKRVLDPSAGTPGLLTLPDLPEIEITDEAAMDARQIGIGAFSPLRGFMGKEEIEGVLRRHRLPDGAIWPLPILLQLTPAAADRISPGMGVRLVRRSNRSKAGTLFVREKFQLDLPELARAWFGTDDPSHPGVRKVLDGGNWILAGPIGLDDLGIRPDSPYDLTPIQARTVFVGKSWSKVVGFHTRNVPHRGHEFLILDSLRRSNADGVFLHPVVGPKKPGDFTADVILEAYERFSAEVLPSSILGAFSSYSRYAGPREAVFTALCRKNYGCSHFVVGRDHTGVGKFYGEDDARRLFESIGDLGITPLFFGKVGYCPECDAVVETCAHSGRGLRSISGTLVRDHLRDGTPIPDWAMRPSLARWLEERHAKGQPIFVR